MFINGGLVLNFVLAECVIHQPISQGHNGPPRLTNKPRLTVTLSLLAPATAKSLSVSGVTPQLIAHCGPMRDKSAWSFAILATYCPTSSRTLRRGHFAPPIIAPLTNREIRDQFGLTASCADS